MIMVEDRQHLWVMAFKVPCMNTISGYLINKYTQNHKWIEQDKEENKDCFHMSAKSVIWIWIRNAHFE